MLPLGLHLRPTQSVKKVAFQLEKLNLEDQLSTFYKILGVPYEKKRRQTKRVRTKVNHTRKRQA